MLLKLIFLSVTDVTRHGVNRSLIFSLSFGDKRIIITILTSSCKLTVFLAKS